MKLPVNQYNSDCMQELQGLVLFISGEPASKANSRRVVKFGNMSRLIKSQKALNYSEHFRQQVTPIDPLMSGDIRMHITIYYASRRPDLDESLILDLLQGVVYINDRQVKERHTYWALDPDNPRAEIVIEQLPEKKPAQRRAKKGSK